MIVHFLIFEFNQGRRFAVVRDSKGALLDAAGKMIKEGFSPTDCVTSGEYDIETGELKRTHQGSKQLTDKYVAGLVRAEWSIRESLAIKSARIQKIFAFFKNKGPFKKAVENARINRQRH